MAPKQDQSQEPGTSSWSPTYVAGAQVLWTIFRCFPKHISSELGLEEEQLGFKQVLIRDPNIAGSSLTCSAPTAAALFFPLL